MNPDPANLSQGREDVLRSYYCPVKVLPAALLDEILIKTSRPISYLIYNQNVFTKFIGIFNTGSGALIYSTFSKSGRNFTGSDLEQVNKKVRG